MPARVSKQAVVSESRSDYDERHERIVPMWLDPVSIVFGGPYIHEGNAKSGRERDRAL